MTREQVEYLKNEHLEASRRYSRATDVAAWREGQPNAEAATWGARMRLTAKAWENAERQLQATTCPPPTPARWVSVNGQRVVVRATAVDP